MSSRSNRLAVIGLATVMISACAGPQVPVDVVIKEAQTDIIFGLRAERVAAAPLPPIMLSPPSSPTFALPAELDPFPFPTETPNPPTTAKAACPTPGPLVPPAIGADSDVADAPKPATYEFRTDGTFEVGGPNAAKGRLPLVTTRRVGNVVQETNSFTYDVTAVVGDRTTVTTYRVVSGARGVRPPPVPATAPTTAPPPGGPAAGTRLSPGFYIVRVVGPNGVPFVPNGDAGMLLLELPVQRGSSFDSVATDGETTMSYRSTQGTPSAADPSRLDNKARVNACGTPLDSWTIALEGDIASATSEPGQPALHFKARYQWAPQFGGIILEERSEVTGGAGLAPVHRTISATINTVPATL